MTLDAADYINKSTLAGNETRRLSRAIEDARTPAERFTIAQGRLDKALAAGAIQQGTYNRLLDAAKQKQDAATRSVENAANAHKKHNAVIGDGIGRLKGFAAAYLGIGTVTKSISLAIDAEQASAAFEVLTGSVEDSNKMLSELRRYSDVSPLSTAGVRDAARTMLGFGLEVKDVIPNIKMLGDIAGGNQQRFDSLTLAFSQMSAAGRLMGQEVLQMVNAGFNPLQEISRKTGESMIELKKRMEDGAISSQEVTDAFRSATEEGGKFHGMTERMADTMGGKLAIAIGDLEKAGIRLGEKFEPIISGIADGFKDASFYIEVALLGVEKFVDGLQAAVAVLKDLINLDMEFSASNKLLDETAKRDAIKREAEVKRLTDEKLRRMNPEMFDTESKAFKDRVASEAARSQAASLGILEANRSAAKVQGNETIRFDLISKEPTPGEKLITDAVNKAVEAIKDNKFTRIR